MIISNDFVPIFVKQGLFQEVDAGKMSLPQGCVTKTFDNDGDPDAAIREVEKLLLPYFQKPGIPEGFKPSADDYVRQEQYITKLEAALLTLRAQLEEENRRAYLAGYRAGQAEATDIAQLATRLDGQGWHPKDEDVDGK